MTERKNENNGSYQDMQCIWMSSRIVDYKLCDKSFDCENCQFDKVIRNLSVETKQKNYSGDPNFSILDSVMQKVKSQVYEPKYVYLKSQLVVKHLFANTYYLGIDPSILSFFDNINLVKDGGHEGYILKNQALFRVEGEWGYMTFTSPMNFTLLDKLNLNPEEIFTNKWYAIIGVNQPEITTARISKELWYSKQANSLKLLNDYKMDFPKIGATMMDGGSSVTNLNRYLGNNEYLKLLSKLFHE
jgi:hypothetical protein